MVGLSSNAADTGQAVAQGFAHRRDSSTPNGSRCISKRPPNRCKNIGTRDFVALLDNINVASDLGAETVWLKSDDVVKALDRFRARQGRDQGNRRPHASAAMAPLCSRATWWRGWWRTQPTSTWKSSRPTNGRNRDERTLAATPDPQRHVADAGVGRSARTLHPAAGLSRWAARSAQTLYRNYISIEAAQHMHAALTTLQRGGARRQGQGRACPGRGRTSCTGSMSRITTSPRSASRNSPPTFERAATNCSTRSPRRRPAHITIANSTELNAPPRRFDRDEQGRDVSRRQPLQPAWAGTSPTNSRRGLVLVLLVGAAVSWGLGWRSRSR